MLDVRRIIVGLDGSSDSDAALGGAVELAERTGASLCLVHVIEPVAFGATSGRGDRPDWDAGTAITTGWDASLVPSGLQVDTLVMMGRPSEVLAGIARHAEGVVIVIGRRGAGHARSQVGHTVAELLATADVPMVVVPSSQPRGAVRPSWRWN